MLLDSITSNIVFPKHDYCHSRSSNLLRCHPVKNLDINVTFRVIFSIYVIFQLLKIVQIHYLHPELFKNIQYLYILTRILLYKIFTNKIFSQVERIFLTYLISIVNANHKSHSDTFQSSNVDERSTYNSRAISTMQKHRDSIARILYGKTQNLDIFIQHRL